MRALAMLILTMSLNPDSEHWEPPLPPEPLPVVVYTVDGCAFCEQAMVWLKGHGIGFVERNIDSDRSYARELHEKALASRLRRGGFPIFDVDGILVVGFDQDRLSQLLSWRISRNQRKAEETSPALLQD